jgi:DNA-directed RNA polymerase
MLVYDAVNHIQSTEWRINKWLLSIVQQCWKADNGQWPGIPPQNQLPHYREIEDYPEDAEDDIKREWRKRAAKVHDDNIKLSSSRLSFIGHLTVAEQMQQYDAIYFPHQLDFRGRIYPVPQPLNPHGCDLSRGLLEFAEGFRLGNGGTKWLFIHLANCFGIDKVPMQERIDWAWDQIDLIHATARPLA